MATNGQFYWPSVGTFVAAYGQFFMAANSPASWQLRDTLMEYCCGFFGGAVLDYLREAQEARMATPVRRIYDFASAAIILVVMAWVFAGLVPL
jgi:hypothetical protein